MSKLKFKNLAKVEHHGHPSLILKATGLALATYILFAQFFIGFVQLDYKSVDTGDGASFSEILESQKNKEPNSYIFKINENELLANLNIESQKPKYLLFSINYLDADSAKVLVSFKKNTLEIAQDRYTITQGENYYKIPKIGSFDEIEIYMKDNFTITLGMNGISTFSRLGMHKQGILLSLCVLLTFLLGRILLRKKSVKNFFSKSQSNIFHFSDFCRNIKREILILVGITLLGYGFFITNFTLSIDEELFWMIKDGSPWVGYGRFGNYFLDKYLTFGSSVMPFVTDALAVVMLFVSALIFAFLFYREQDEKQKSNGKYTIFAGLFLTFPFVNGDFMAFSVYNLWVAIGYFLTALSILFLRSLRESEKILEITFAIFSLAAALSIYQSFISVFLVMFLMLELQKAISSSKGIVFREWMNSGLIMFFALITYFLMNALAQKFITPAYGYIGSLVGWNRDSTYWDVISRVSSGIIEIYLGTYGSSGRILAASVALFLIFILKEILYKHGYLQKIKVLLISMFFLAAPFVTAIALGSMLPARSLSGLPLLLGGIWLIVLTNIKDLSLKRLTIASGAFLLFFQIQYLNALFYGDFLRYQSDISMGRQIIHQIEVNGYDYRRYPIVFLGQHKFDSSKLISEINSGGRSFFDDASQAYRMTYFLRTLGFNVLMPSGVESSKALSQQLDEIWPQPGSVVFRENIIIVKLS